MNIKKIFSKKSITFTVTGKPPQKSQWGTKDAELVIKLREAALKARNNAGINQCITTPIKLSITIYAPNIDDINYSQDIVDDPKLYIGDLDSLVAGICDYLHKGPKKENKFIPSPLFDNKPEIGPDIPLIIDDDSKIISIMAEKKVSEKQIYYTVKIELL